MRRGDRLARDLLRAHREGAPNRWRDPSWHPEVTGKRRRRLELAFDRVALQLARIARGGAPADQAFAELAEDTVTRQERNREDEKRQNRPVYPRRLCGCGAKGPHRRVCQLFRGRAA